MLAADDDGSVTREPGQLLLFEAILQLLVDCDSALGVEDEDLHFAVEHLAVEANVDGCLDLVASEHPEARACRPDGADCLADVILQLVLDGRASYEREVTLDLLSNGIDSFLLALKALCCLEVLFVPLLVELRVDLFLSQDQSP